MGHQEHERNQEIARLIQENKISLAEIGERYGITRQRVSRIGQQMNVSRPKKEAKPKRSVLPKEERMHRLQAAAMRANQKKRRSLEPRNARIEELARAGWKYEDIAEEISRTFGKIHQVTVSVVLRKRGYHRGKWGKGRKSEPDKAA